ncbi:hypothetical protein BX070DRAFT_252760 [Coemansia spiralis]|nr:hypothetical protein BX070DRAFT_252760 [Coemansia spiralis]
MAIPENKTRENIWTPEAELALYMSMVGLRPVGIHKSFRLINIYTRLQTRLGSNIDITIGDVRERLNSLFNVQLLDEIEDDYEEDEENEEEEDGDEEASTGKGKEASTHSINKSKVKSSVADNKSEKRIESDEELKDAENSKVDEEDDDNSNKEAEDEDSEAGSGAEGDEGADDDGNSTTSKKKTQSDGGFNIASFIPATSIGATLDTSDPLFWRKKSVDFTLPWAEFGTLMVEKAGVGVSEDHDDAEMAERSASVTPAPTMTSTPTSALTPKMMTPELEDDGDAEAKANDEQAQDIESDGERASPVLRRRKGRSLTPVPRSRPKSSRVAAATTTTSSTRKKAKGR